MLRSIRHIFDVAFYIFIAFCWTQTVKLQGEANQQATQIKEDNQKRAEEERTANQQILEKTERFMNDMKHEVAIQVARNVQSVCRAQLDPNCEYLQSIVKSGQVKAAELGTTDQEITGLVQKYRARYAAYYAANGQ